MPPAAVHVAGSTPYPWPWHGRLDARALALLVVTGPGGTAGAGDMDGQAGHGAAALATAVRAAGGLVVGVRTAVTAVTAQGLLPRDPLPPGPVPAGGTAIPVDRTVAAPGKDGFYGSPLDALLRSAGRDLLLLAGHHLEIEVHSALRSANDRGYECLLVHDACAAADPELRAAALSTIEMSGGIFGAVGSVDAVIAALSPRHLAPTTATPEHLST